MKEMLGLEIIMIKNLVKNGWLSLKAEYKNLTKVPLLLAILNNILKVEKKEDLDTKYLFQILTMMNLISKIEKNQKIYYCYHQINYKVKVKLIK